MIFEDILLRMGFDEKSLRILISLKELNKLPFKEVNQSEMYRIKESWFFNPIYYYPKKSKIKKGEIGHDEKYRYILKKEK